MKPEDFSYELPPELVAQQPLAERSASRLLNLRSDGVPADLAFPDLAGLLRPGDLLVVNDTRVIPARLLGAKRSGGRVEMLVERVLGERLALVQLRSSHAPRPGGWLDFGTDSARVCERQEPFFVLEFSAPVMAVLERSGHVPLPPYIRRPDAAADQQRYQTLFARQPGAVAAPTAGLHFDSAMLERLAARGVGLASVTLHVGAGTFAPLRPAQLVAGRLHAERLEVKPAVVSAIDSARAAGGRIVAVGTTVVRALETAACAGRLAPHAGETDLFITPGYRFQVVDALVTNFHLPQSSLLMLVCAFGGSGPVLAAYRHAVLKRYRFFSYGDAMFLERQQQDPGR